MSKTPLLGRGELLDEHRRRVAVRHVRLAAAALVLIVVYMHSAVVRHALFAPVGWLVGSERESGGGLGSGDLDGPLRVPDTPQCRGWHGTAKTYPVATYPVTTGPDRALWMEQNATHGHDENDRCSRRVHISGDVVVRRTEGEAEVVVEAVSNDARITTAYAWSESAVHGQSLVVMAAGHVAAAAQGFASPCLGLRVTVWLPDVTELGNLTLATTHLAMTLRRGLDVDVAQHVRLSTVAGDVAKEPDAHLAAADAEVRAVSGHIDGAWTLRERLHIGTVSGHVHVDVATTNPASELSELVLSTVSGAIVLAEDGGVGSLVATTRSGNIHGHASFFRSAHVATTSGDIGVRVAALALGPADLGPADLTTASVSGTTRLVLLDAANPLTSTHTTVSGGVDLQYPASWAGAIRLHSRASGRLGVSGRGVHVVPDTRPHWPPRVQHTLEATKDRPDGAGRDVLSSVNVETVSGSVSLAFPE